jgi:signal transduction histidine kinase
MGLGRNAWLAAARLVLAAATALAAEPKRVLLVHSFGPDFQAEDVFAGHLRTDLAEKSPYPLERYEVSLEIARLAEGDQDAAIVEYLKALFAGRPPDLVVTMIGPAARFAQRRRHDLFPSTPFLFAALDARVVNDEALTANDAVVAVSTDVHGIIDTILRVLPSVNTIAVVIGNSPIEKFWVKELHQVTRPFENRINFIFLHELSLEDMLIRAAALPPRSAIFFGDFVVDGRGVPYRQQEVLSRLHAVANAPLFGQYDYQLGQGILGGPLFSIHSLCEKTAEVAANILRGITPGDIKTPPLGLANPELDWREMQRWGVTEAGLPPNSTIRFREPTLWEQYKLYFVAAAAFSGLEGILIIALLLNRWRLRRAHDALQASEEGMSLAAISAKLRFWMWDIPRDEVRASKSDWSSGNWHSAEPINFDQFIRVVHADDRPSLRQAVQRTLEGDGDFRAEYRVVSPDSTVRWIAARGRIEFDHTGKAKQLRAVSIDITERRRAEDEARELSGRLITAHEDERARLARALHDDITQRLAVLAIDAGRKERGLGDTTAGQAMRSIRREMVQLSEDVHSLSYALHPAILEDLGLIEALKAECARFSALEAIPVSFRAEGKLDEPPRPVALCLYRVAQEALRNVVRHASATLIEVGLYFVDGGLQLAVCDNGVGFDAARKKARPSLGHASMRQRLSLVGGELRVDSAPGRGTTVLAWASLNKEAYRESSAGVDSRRPPHGG